MGAYSSKITVHPRRRGISPKLRLSIKAEVEGERPILDGGALERVLGGGWKGL